MVDTIPTPIVAFLSGNDFSGKTIVPVCTNVGNRLGETLRISPSFARNLDGLAVRGGDAKKIAQNEVHVRLHELEMI